MSESAVAPVETEVPIPRAATQRTRWWRDPWRKPRFLGAFTWAYLAWSILPVAIAVLFSFNADAFNQWVDTHPDDLVARNVGLVRGPRPQTAVPYAKPPFGGLGGFWVGVLGVASMSLFAVIGLGWAILLLGRWLTPLPLLAVSPAVGIAALVLAGVFVDRVGIRLGGAGGIFALVLATMSSWAVLGIGRLRARS